MQASPESNAAEASGEEINDAVLSEISADELSKALQSGLPQGPASRLPRRIPGGFRAIEEEMERRGREWTQTMRLIEQNRMQLEAAERERDALQEKLRTLTTEVQEAGRSLKSTLDASKSGDVSGNLTAQFESSMHSLEALEKTSAALNANFMWVRSAWEQYARAVAQGQKMREMIR